MIQKKVAHVLADLIIAQDIDIIFTVSGGSIHEILYYLDVSPQVRLVPCYNEQGAIYAAESYARESGKPGVCIVTSGPGLTNIITGINCSWVDSVPVFVIAGQVVTSQKLTKAPVRLRQRGVQESDTHSLVSGIVKASVSLDDSELTINVFSYLWHLMLTDRMGPVLLELPVDISYKQIEFDEQNVPQLSTPSFLPTPPPAQWLETLERLKTSSNPLFVIGNGVRSADSSTLTTFLSELKRTGAFFVSTWATKDLCESKQKNRRYLGSPGIFGNRKANAQLALSDFVLVIGSSFSFTHTGYRVSSQDTSKYHIVDIDPSQALRSELSKANYITCDLNMILPDLIQFLESCGSEFFQEKDPDLFASLADLETRQPTSPPINLISNLSSFLQKERSDNYTIITDMGTSFTATHHYLYTSGTRLFTASGHAPMGWCLPGAVGASLASPTKTIIAITGDGGLLMNVQELMHLSHYNLNIKLILFNNNGYATIIKTSNRYHGITTASSPSNGIVNPDFEQLCAAYSLPYVFLDDNTKLSDYLCEPGPMFIELNYPQDVFTGPKLAPQADGRQELLNMQD